MLPREIGERLGFEHALASFLALANTKFSSIKCVFPLTAATIQHSSTPSPQSFILKCNLIQFYLYGTMIHVIIFIFLNDLWVKWMYMSRSADGLPMNIQARPYQGLKI